MEGTTGDRANQGWFRRSGFWSAEVVLHKTTFAKKHKVKTQANTAKLTKN